MEGCPPNKSLIWQLSKGDAGMIRITVDGEKLEIFLDRKKGEEIAASYSCDLNEMRKTRKKNNGSKVFKDPTPRKKKSEVKSMGRTMYPIERDGIMRQLATGRHWFGDLDFGRMHPATARPILDRLVKLGLASRSKEGRKVYYTGTETLQGYFV